VLNYNVFPDNFHRVEPIFTLALNQKYFAESTATYAFYLLEVLKRGCNHGVTTEQQL
jgi:hypothetical protein